MGNEAFARSRISENPEHVVLRIPCLKLLFTTDPLTCAGREFSMSFVYDGYEVIRLKGLKKLLVARIF